MSTGEKEICPRLYVELPSLSPEQRKQYKDAPMTLTTANLGYTRGDIIEVVGELQEGKSVYWFVSFRDGIMHKV